jgi:Transposase DDE domain
LLIEWPGGEKEPTHYTLNTLPAGLGLPELVRLTKARWRVERTYEDMKGELGLDHYDGRSWVGWQHHVSAVLACYALVVACQRRAFPPPRPPGRVTLVRSRARPERHVADSFITVRLAITRLVRAWLAPVVRRERARRARARRRKAALGASPENLLQ